MELTLERSDLCQVGTISHLNTLALTEDKKSGRLRIVVGDDNGDVQAFDCLLYTSPSPRDPKTSRMPSSA